MKHLSHEQLWQLALNGTAAEPHLDACLTCLSALDDIKAAQGVLRAMPEPPPMPAAMARRVEVKLLDVLEARQAKAWTSWFPSMPRFAFAAIAMAVLVGGAWVLAQQTKGDEVLPVALGPPPVVMPASAEPKLTATVASAKNARSSNAALKTTQVLREGSSLSTDKGGSLWVRLPDGSRAGLTAASEMKLHTLEEKTLTLELAKGSVALVVPHREDRLLTVRAGELEVRDLGTQFLVSREVGRIVVAVEEGSVEVRVPGLTRTVRAGQAVAYQQGQLDELEPLRPVPPKVRPPPRIEEQPAVTAQVVAEAADDESPPPPEVDDPAAEWAQAPVIANSPAAENANVPPMPPNEMVTATPRPGLSLGAIERRVNDLRRQIRSSFTQGGSLRQQRARDIGRAADAGDCLRAVDLANEWLRYAHDPPEEIGVRREVLFQKMRCLRRMGRVPEADLVRRELEAMP